MNTLHTASCNGEWSGWEAKLRDDDSLVIEYWSAYHGSMTGVKWRFSNTGLLDEISNDPELDPEAAIETFVDKSDPEMEGAKLLKRGSRVQ